MTNNPNSENLGSAYSLLGFRYDESGMQAFLAALAQAKAAQEQFEKQQGKLPARRPTTSRPTTQTDQQAAAAVIKLAQAEAQLARRIGDSAAELAALRRAQQAAQGDRVAFLRTTEKVIAAEQRLQKEQSKGNGTGPALPRTFAGFSGSGLVQALGAAGIITSVDQLIGSVKQLADESAVLYRRAETIGTAYETSTRRAGVSADQLLEKLKAASRGTVTETNLQASANAALALGVGENAQQIADLLAIARQKGRDFGLSTQESFQAIVDGLGRASPEILNNIGLVIDSDQVYKAYAKQIGTTADKLTDQQKVTALVNDLIKNNTDLIKQNADAKLDAADKEAQARAKLEEAKTQFGKAVAPIQTGFLTEAADFINNIQGIGPFSEQVVAARAAAMTNDAKNYADYVQRIETLKRQLTEEDDTQLKVPSTAANEFLDTTKLTEAQFEAARAAQAQTSAYAGAYDATLGQAEALKKLDAAQRQGKLSAEDLQKAQTALADVLIHASDQITNATAQRDEQLTQLAEQHQQRIDELNQESIDAAQKTADDLAAAEADGARDRQKILDNAAEQRQKLISSAQQVEIEREQRYQRELAQARIQAQASELRSTADFIERLYDLTRGRRGRNPQERAEARRLFGEAQQQAAQIADPELRARYLQIRQQQILDEIQQRRDAAQLRKDARRGGSLGAGDAAAEIAEEQQLRNDANQAELEAILAQDRAKQEQREQERNDAANNLQAQLNDLEKNTNDQLVEADRRNEERLGQIRQHGEQQQAQIEENLKKEEAAYQEQQNRIRTEYAQFLSKLTADLRKQANEIDLTPEEKRQKELANAYAELGKMLGESFTAGLQGAVQNGQFAPPSNLEREPQPQRRPPAQSTPTTSGKGPGLSSPQATTRSRGSVVGQPGKDTVLSDQAIDQVVVGGRQSDGFSSLRGSQLHAGVDLAVPTGTPVKSPVDGTVIGVGATAAGGNYVKVRSANNDVWYFGHLSRASVRAGDQVRRGQQVALSGATGTAVTGPHLHLQLQPGGGRAADPTAALEALAGGTSATGNASTGGGSSSRPQSTAGATAPVSPPSEAISNQYNQFAAAPPASGAPVIQNTSTVDLRGATFGTGVSMKDVEQAVERGVQQGMDETARQLNQTVQQLGTQGAMAV